MIGFAHKKNAKRTLENNFIKGEDYKILLLPKGKQVLHGGHNEEKIMLNIDTFKNMCMLVKTEKSKTIRKYYVKLQRLFLEKIGKTDFLLYKNGVGQFVTVKQNVE
jgi:phage anti-repressor protein